MELDKLIYTVSYRNIKYPRIEFITGSMSLILPYGYNPQDILNKHKGWILKKFSFIEQCLKDSSNKALIPRTDEEFRKLVHHYIRDGSEVLKVRIRDVYFRKMKTKWASISSRKNITMNSQMKQLPESLIRYVVFHELVHMIEHRHSKRFFGILSAQFDKHEVLDQELSIYWFKLQD
ncbi:MAG: M48 family metallopeptidase [Deltaproteobacteria bacterium]|nr:M48 family metallopeptidase [Deltaproteobacteria bacterium]MCL5277624.1 M48 family metallopeptidase [Deltaproteobacteria bacterium]